MYIYIYIYIHSKFGGCTRQDSPAKRNPVKTGNASTTTTTTITNNNGRCEGESQGSSESWVRRSTPCVCRPSLRSARERWHRAWPAIDGTVRGPRSMTTTTTITTTTTTNNNNNA